MLLHLSKSSASIETFIITRWVQSLNFMGNISLNICLQIQQSKILQKALFYYKVHIFIMDMQHISPTILLHFLIT